MFRISVTTRWRLCFRFFFFAYEKRSTSQRDVIYKYYFQLCFILGWKPPHVLIGDRTAINCDKRRTILQGRRKNSASLLQDRSIGTTTLQFSGLSLYLSLPFSQFAILYPSLTTHIYIYQWQANLQGWWIQYRLFQCVYVALLTV